MELRFSVESDKILEYLEGFESRISQQFMAQCKWERPSCIVIAGRATLAARAVGAGDDDGVDWELEVSRRCTFIPIIQTWRGFQHWEVKCPEENLVILLWDWPSRAKTSESKSKYHERKIKGEEYTRMRHQGFLELYYPYKIPLKELERLIRAGRRRQ